MGAMAWNESLSVGISGFDMEHKRLIQLFNDFHESISNKDSKEKMVMVIKGLKEYTVYHFRDEEGKMKLHNFPGYLAHKEEHDKFVKAVLDLEERFQKGKMILTIEIINFIRDWITKHILTIDKQYTKFLNAKGVR